MRSGHQRCEPPRRQFAVRSPRVRQARGRIRHVQLRRSQGPEWRDGGLANADSADARRAETNHRGDEIACRAAGNEETMTTATFRIWRGDGTSGGQLHTYTTAVSEGMVVLD